MPPSIIFDARRGAATTRRRSVPAAHLQKSNCTLNFTNRACMIDCGCCHAAKLLFCVNTVLLLNRL